MSKELEPWEQLPDVWKSEAAYFNWIRGAMRKAWCRHPIKVAYMNKNRFKAPMGKKTFKNPDGQMVWATTCETCHKVHKVGNTEVDHIVRAGGCKSWEEFNPWIKSLLHINFNGLAIICKPCHRIKSYAEQHSISFEEAKLRKRVIAFMKQTASQQIAWFQRQQFDPDAYKNAKARKETYTYYLREL